MPNAPGFSRQEATLPSVTFPSPGWYCVTSSLDDVFPPKVPEDNELNNVGSFWVYAHGPQPDLTPIAQQIFGSGHSGPDIDFAPGFAPVVGGPVVFTTQVGNVGELAAGPTTLRATLLGPGGPYSPLSIPVGALQPSPVTPFVQSGIVLNFGGGYSLGGTFTVTVTADDPDAETEISETNNTVSRSFEVSADLACEGIVGIPMSVAPGQFFQPIVTLKNQGVLNTTGALVCQAASKTDPQRR